MASISEPYLLHSYAVPTTAGPSNSRGLPHVQARGGWGDVAEVVVTVQGDGIHTYDRTSLHPVSAYTLGPSTFYRCAAASRVGKGGKRSAYVAVAAGTDLKDGSKTAWVWPEGSEDTASRSSVELPHPIEEFLYANSLPSKVIVAHSDGHLTLASSTLEIIHELPPPFTISGRPKNIIFPKSNLTASIVEEASFQALVVSFFGNEEGKFGVRIVKVEDDKMSEVDWAQVEDINASDVLSVSCEASGNASILLSSGQCFSLHISASSSVSYSLAPTPITTALPKSSTASPQASLLGLMSTHLLLAVASPSTRQLQLELWDTRYPVKLANYTMSLPASLPEKFGLHLSQAGGNQALLSLTSPLGEKKNDGKSRSSVYIVPYSVPQASSLLNALGRLQLSDTQRPEVDVGLSESQRKLVNDVEAALRAGKSQDAQKTFNDWVNLQTQATANGHHAPEGEEEESDEDDIAAPSSRLLDEESDEEATLTNGRELNGTTQPKPTTPAAKKQTPLLHFPVALVEQLLDVLLFPPKPATEAHSTILRSLMRRGLVSYNMVKGDQKLLDVLLERNDWASVVVALRMVVDIPESAIVRVLMASLKGTGAPAPLPLPKVLAAVLAAPITRPALRLALREQLTDMADVCRLLEVLQGWLEQSGLSGLELDQEAGIVEVDFRPKPRVDAILSFVETLLDTYYISLLQHAPSRPILKSLSTLLAPQITLAAQLDRLRGPLEVFAKRRREQRKAGVPQKAVSRFEEGRRRKRAQEEADMQVGVYRVEEVFF